MGGQRQAPAALPLGKTRYPLYKKLGGPQGRSGQGRKISPSLEFNPRTAQSLASRYTDWDIPVHVVKNKHILSVKVTSTLNKYYKNLLTFLSNTKFMYSRDIANL